MELPIRVLLVEDNEVFREALEFLLQKRDDIIVVGSAADGSTAVEAAAELEPEVVVIDYRLPDLDGAAVAEEIRARAPLALPVFLSASAGETGREAARLAGIPLVRKDEGVDALVDAIRRTAREEPA